jgi:hypothetical protein
MQRPYFFEDSDHLRGELEKISDKLAEKDKFFQHVFVYYAFSGFAFSYLIDKSYLSAIQDWEVGEKWLLYSHSICLVMATISTLISSVNFLMFLFPLRIPSNANSTFWYEYYIKLQSENPGYEVEDAFQTIYKDELRKEIKSASKHLTKSFRRKSRVTIWAAFGAFFFTVAIGLHFFFF